VNLRGQPIVQLVLAGQTWDAVIDTGFTGELELPEPLFTPLRPLFQQQRRLILGGGQTVVEDIFLVDFPFDGEIFSADATFVDTTQILLGTHLLRNHHLEIDFPARTVRLDRVP
jgi:predicted aspartyl protease